MNRAVFITASILQVYFIPLLLSQIFFTTAMATKSSVLMYMLIKDDVDLKGPDEPLEMLNRISFIPIVNIVGVFYAGLLIVAFVFYKKQTTSIIVEYYREVNPVMYNLTNNILNTLPLLHEVELIKDDIGGFATKGMRGIIIEEVDGKYDILFPYQGVISMKKEDVKDVQIKVNS